MLSPADNEMLCRVGPGTPMGKLLREYWMPMLMSKELPDPDCPPKRVKLLGEDLIAWRNTDGSTAVMQNACPHRGASMFFGRNEENGLRCVYHGWKFDAEGTCVDMPNEPAESNFKHKIKATAYPTWEKSGMIWAYMGPRTTPPPIPALEFNTAPDDWCYEPTAMLECNNFIQGIEGDTDTSHIDYVHARLHLEPVNHPNPAIRGFNSHDKSPTLQIVPTDYGAFYAGKRRWHEGENMYWYRITQYLFPFWTMIAASDPNRISNRCWVPLDDSHTVLYNLPVSVSGPLSPEKRKSESGATYVGGYVDDGGDPLKRYMFKANASNDYMLDYELQKTTLFCGIPFAGNLSDIAMTESMGAIYQRDHEHLGTSDSMVIWARRALLKAIKAHEETGAVPPSVDDANLFAVRSASILLPEGEDWVAATEKSRYVKNKVPVSYVVPR